MTKSDKKLGMDRPITRRDFVHGVGAIGAAVAFAGPITACRDSSISEQAEYPPKFTGMRGNHDSSFTVAHALGREGKTDWGPVQNIEDQYDLVIVGAGISGLAAACFYRQEKPNSRILVLDNHDDFGGHAKRNEFEIEGRTFLTHGGSMFLTSPYGYSDVVKNLLSDLGVDFSRLVKSVDFSLYTGHGLYGAFHFNKEKWGRSATVGASLSYAFNGPVNPSISTQEMIDQFPVSQKARQELLHLFTIEADQLPDLSQEEKVAYLKKTSYRDFLIQQIGVTEQDVFDFLQDHAADMGLGIEACDAYLAMTYAEMPGWPATGIETYKKEDLTGFHMFPDGNASVTRLMVRSLIPDVAPGNTMEDVVMAPFDYGKLDQSSSAVRIRLNSTAINASNDGDGAQISYVREEKAYRVKAKKCVLACNNAVIPYICPELPDEQKEALSNQVRQPILSNRVLVKNWHAWKELGIQEVLAPGGYHTSIGLNLPMNLGGYSCPQEPDEPTIIGMFRYLHVNNEGLTAQEQFRIGRHELLSTPFEEIERHIRAQLDELLGKHGFNAAEDIEAIIVNRWAHGYAYSHHFHTLFDQDYDDLDDERYPHVKGRKPLGHITIANSDSGADAMLECAIDQAYRAVRELQAV